MRVSKLMKKPIEREDWQEDLETIERDYLDWLQRNEASASK